MKNKAFIGASLIAGIAASLCCILPIVFALAGAGIVGAAAFFAAWRPYLLGITFLLLGLGFYFAYRKPKHACEPGSPCEKPATNRTGRIGLWIAAVGVLIVAAFPYYSEPVAKLLLTSKGSETAAAAPRLDRAMEGKSQMINPTKDLVATDADSRPLVHLFRGVLQYKSQAEEEAIVPSDGREGAYIGSGDGTVKGDQLSGTVRWSLWAGNCVYPLLQRSKHPRRASPLHHESSRLH